MDEKLISIEFSQSETQSRSRNRSAFSIPQEVDDINSYYTLTDKTEAVCDRCKARLKKPEGHFVSGWIFRQSDKNAQLAVTLMAVVQWASWCF
jgi:hypothetical protein